MPFVFLKPLEVESNLPPHIARFTYDSFVDTTLSEEAKRTSTETNRDCSSSDDSVVSSYMWCCTFCDVLLEGLEKGSKCIDGQIVDFNGKDAGFYWSTPVEKAVIAALLLSCNFDGLLDFVLR